MTDAHRYQLIVRRLLNGTLPHATELLIAAFSHAAERGADYIEKQDVDAAIDRLTSGETIQ